MRQYIKEKPISVFVKKNWLFSLSVLGYVILFNFDIMSPLGFITLVFYLLPILLNLPLKPGQIYSLATVGTVFIAAALFMSPPGIPFWISALERTTTIIILWLAAAAGKQRIETKKIMRVERDLLQVIYDNVPVLFNMYDKSLKNFRSNRYMEHLTGWTPADTEKPDFMEKAFPDPNVRIKAIKHMTSLSPDFVDFTMIGKDGSRIETSWTNISLPGGRQLGIGLDISMRKQAEEILKRDKETFERMVEERSRELFESRRMAALGLVASTVSHELRSPLAAINAAAMNIKRKSAEPAIKKNLATIEKKVSVSANIIENLLYFSKSRPLSLEPFPACALADNALQDMKRTGFSGKELNIRKKCDLGADDLIEADIQQMTQVFMNILGNAADAVPAVNGEIEISISSYEKNEAVIVVSDNGAGIQEEDIEKIFEPFYSKKRKGTGLGLSITRNIIESHGGSIRARSGAGRKGASIIVTLPLKKRADYPLKTEAEMVKVT